MLGRGLGWIRIDEAARAPLKAGYLREARNDLDMPVIVVVCWHVKGLRMQKVIVCGLADRTLDTTDNVAHKPRSFSKLTGLRIFKPRLMPPRREPDFIAEPARIGAKSDEVLGQS